MIYCMESQWSDGVFRVNDELADAEEFPDRIVFTWTNDCGGLCRITVFKEPLVVQL